VTFPLPGYSVGIILTKPQQVDSAQRRYAMPPDDIALAKDHRRSHNRLGFAVQIALVALLHG